MRRATFSLGLLVACACAGFTASAAADVYLNAAFANRAVEPTQFGPNEGPGTYVDDPTWVHAITWQSWGGAQATGEGLIQPNVSSLDEPISHVSVTLSGLQGCGGLMVYTAYELQLLPPSAPPLYWSSGKAGGFPCHVNAGAYYPGGPRSRELERHGECPFEGLEVNDHTASDFGWLPGSNKPLAAIPWKPRFSGAYSLFCRMDWSGWGGPTVTGEGVLRNGFDQWGVRATLSDLAWCPKLGVTYTRLQMNVYGTGEPIPSGNLSQATARRLRQDVSRSRHRSYTQVEPAVAGCV